MSLVKYDIKAAVDPIGFVNRGSNCYANAVTQALLSCTSFLQNIFENRSNPLYKQNGILMQFIRYLAISNTALSEEKKAESLSTTGYNIATHLIEYSAKRQDKSHWGKGQQCASETFSLLFDYLDGFDQIKQLFTYRVRTYIKCLKCQQVVSSRQQEDNVYAINPTLKINQSEELKDIDSQYEKTLTLQEYIKNQGGYVDKDYICSSCKTKGDIKYSVTKLSHAPEVLIVQAKKFEQTPSGDLVAKKIMTEFPETLEFKGKESVIKFQAVAQIEHIGSLKSGHYWAICRRRDGWYSFDDNKVTKKEFKPTENTYIVVYHVV